MLRQNGGGNKRGLGLSRFSTSNFFTISNSGSWGMGRSTKSNSLSSISSSSDCYDSPVVDPEYIMLLVNDVRKFADVLLYLKEAFLSEEHQSLHQVVHERLGELLRVLKAVISKHQTLNSVDILGAAGTVIAKVKAVNFKEINEENKREHFSEIFSSIDTLAFTFGNVVSDFLMGDVDNGSSLGFPVSRRSRSFENISVEESAGSIHERDDIEGPLRAEEVDNMLLRIDSGIEAALSYAKAWSKYTKDVLAWLEKRLSLELECAKSLAKIGEAAKVTLGPQDYMPFQSILSSAFQNDIENGQLLLQTAAALQSNKFMQPVQGRRSELDKQRKEVKDLWQRELKKMQELEVSLKKAKQLSIQRHDEHDKARSNTVRAEEELLNSSAGLMKESNKQFEKKRRLEEEALQKAEEAKENYKTLISEVEEKRNDMENIKSDVLTQLRELIYQCDLTLKAAAVNLFQMQHAQVVSLPVNFQALCESAKLYEPGHQYSEFVKSLPKEDGPIESGMFESRNAQSEGLLPMKRPLYSTHSSQGNVSQGSGDFPNQSLEDNGSPVYSRSQNIGQKRSCSSTDIQAIRGPPPFRSWSVGNQSSGMCSDSESAGGSSESRSMDSPSASPGDFKRRLPRTPSTGTMSSADDLDEREPPSPSDIGLNDLASEMANSPGPFRNIVMSKAAQTHKLRKLRAPSKCRECDSLVVFHGAECEECSLACHKKCLETLAIQCGHKKLHGRLHLFGVDFAQAARNAPDGIPAIIKKCTYEIESRALNVKGIYRVNGAKSRVEKLCQAFENGNDLVELSELYAHDISNVLKLYLRQLPEPLILFRLYNEFIGLAKESQHVNEELDSKQTSPNSKKRLPLCVELNRIIIKMRDLLKQLPATSYTTLQYLVGHLHRVAEQVEENKMSASNLGIIFGPTLIRPRQTDATISLSSLVDYPYQARMVELLITYYEKVFDVPRPENSSSSQSEENYLNETTFTAREQDLQKIGSPELLTTATEDGICVDGRESEFSDMKLFEWTAERKNANEKLDEVDGSGVTRKASLDKDHGSSSPIMDAGSKANNSLPLRSYRHMTKVQMRSPRGKASIRPVSLPVDTILSSSVLYENKSRNIDIPNEDNLTQRAVTEEVSETNTNPTVKSCKRISSYEPQTLRSSWGKQYKQYDLTQRTAMIMTNVPQEEQAHGTVHACVAASSYNAGNNQGSAIPAHKPYSLPVRTVKTVTEGTSTDSIMLTAFRGPRTLQPPPGTFYKPPCYSKANQNEDDSKSSTTTNSVTSPSQDDNNSLKYVTDMTIQSDAPVPHVNWQRSSSTDDSHQADLKPAQRLRPKRIQELEHREAHFV